ncbi:MAG: hypothetical protein ACRCX5_02850 [Bacteroidales bacterium]
MKKIYLSFVIILLSGLTLSAQNWSENNNNRNGGYYMGPGMMWNDNNGYGCYGPGMMWGNWGNHDWHKQAQSNLKLNQGQVSNWNNVISKSAQNQKAADDSIQYYVSQIRRLQKNKSDMVQEDLNQIKQTLTPDQYTQLLQELVTKK